MRAAKTETLNLIETFVEKYKNIEFVEALREISNIVGLDFDSFSNTKKKNNREEQRTRI